MVDASLVQSVNMFTASIVTWPPPFLASLTYMTALVLMAALPLVGPLIHSVTALIHVAALNPWVAALTYVTAQNLVDLNDRFGV